MPNDHADYAALAEALGDHGEKLQDFVSKYADRIFLIEQKMANGEVPYGGSHAPGAGIADEILSHSHFQLFKEGGSKSVRIQLERPLFETKTTITSSTTLVPPQRQPEIRSPAQRRMSVRDLLVNTPITSGSLEYVKETGFTNAAAPVAETVAKPESALTFSLVTGTVRTIAHWIPASKQVLDDAQQLKSYIDRRLLFGLQIVEEDQLLSGDGTGQNLTGLIPAATAYDTSMNIMGDTQLDKLRHGIRQLELSFHQPTGIVLHPTDWEKIELIKDDNARYIFGDPKNGGSTNVWSVPRVTTPAIAAGTFLLGDFGQGCELFDRQLATVEISTEHASFFTENKIAIRAEERLLLAIYKPLALVYGTF